MSDYGVTKNGFVRKRYDTIYSELQGDIKDGLGIDVSINPKSFFNVLLSSVADKLAVAWELAEMVYYSHYPATAEGVNLDYACQFGGLTREEGSKTKYSILFLQERALHQRHRHRFSSQRRKTIPFRDRPAIARQFELCKLPASCTIRSILTIRRTRI